MDVKPIDRTKKVGVDVVKTIAGDGNGPICAYYDDCGV